MMERSPLQYLSKTFTRSSKVTSPNIRKGLVKVTFPSHFQYLNGSLSKSLRSLKCACLVEVGVGVRGLLHKLGTCNERGHYLSTPSPSISVALSFHTSTRSLGPFY